MATSLVPAEFFVHRHVRGKRACKCCQTLSQAPVDPQLIDKGMPAPGLVAHVLVSRFVDHIPYYRQETINARSGVHTPRTTLASNLMRPWAMGRKAWLFAGSELAGKRASTVMSLVQSARMYGHDPWLYPRDVLTRLPTHPAREIDALLPHRWTPPQRG